MTKNCILQTNSSTYSYILSDSEGNSATIKHHYLFIYSRCPVQTLNVGKHESSMGKHLILAQKRNPRWFCNGIHTCRLCHHHQQQLWRRRLCLSTASRRRRRCKGRSTSPPADADLHCLDMASSSGVVRSKSRVLWQGEEPSWKDPCSLLPRSPPPRQPNQRAPPGWGELGGCGRSNFGVFVNRGEPGTQAGRCTLIRHV